METVTPTDQDYAGENQEVQSRPLQITLELPPADARGARYFSTERYRAYMLQMCDGDSDRCDGVMGGNTLPERLHSNLLRAATNEASQLAESKGGSPIVAVYLGGKGRVLGVPFVQLLKDQMVEQYVAQGFARSDALQQVTERIHVFGADGGLNIGHGVLAGISPDFAPDDETVTSRQKQAISDAIHSGTDPYISQMRAYIGEQMRRVTESTGHADQTWLLIDDQRSTGLTETFARELVTQVADEVGIQVDVHPLTRLTINWDHVPRYLIDEAIGQSINRRAALSHITGQDLSGYSDDQLSRRGLPAIAGELGVDARAFHTWYLGLTADVEGYVMRGGYSKQDEDGQPLVIQQPYPGHIMKYEGDVSGHHIQVEFDASQAVRVYTEELNGLTSGQKKDPAVTEVATG